MPSGKRTLRLLILGVQGLSEIIEQWRQEYSKDIEPLWVDDFDEFLAIDPGSIDVILTDVDGLGRGAREVIRHVKRKPPTSSVVVQAAPHQTATIAELLRAGADEYILRTDDEGYPRLLVTLLDRAGELNRDLPLAMEGVSESHFWAFLDSVPIPMKVLDEEGIILHANPALTTFLYRDREALEGEEIFDFMHEDEVTEARDAYRELIEQGQPQSQKMVFEDRVLPDRRYRRRNGETIWANLYLMPLWDTDGSLFHIVGFMVDITDRKETMLQLKHIEAHQRAILNTAVDGILTIDNEGMIEMFNRSCEEIFGYQSKEIEGRSVKNLFDKHDVERLLDALPDTDSSTFDEQVELEGIRKDQSRVPLEVSIGVMNVDGERNFTIVVRDITERKEFLDRIFRSERMEAVGQLAGGIAHDFNNILTIINTHAYLLSIDEGLQTEEAKNYVHKILSATEQGTRLTKQLLSLTPSPLSRPTPIDLNEAVGNMKHLFQSIIEEDIEVQTQLGDRVPPVLADLSQVEQILLNLVINARDAMPQGGIIEIQTAMALIPPPDQKEEYYRGLPPGEYAVMRVCDTGSGVPEEIQDDIFDPYFSTKEPGTGLGLATVYNIAERHGGAVILEESSEEGSIFTVYLPAHYPRDSDAKNERQNEKLPPKRPEKQDRETLLLVEDEEDIQEALAAVLGKEGYKVLSASSGEEALRLAKNYPETIDLVITDLVMPGMTGVELANQFQLIDSRIPIIFVSGYSGGVLQRKEITPEQAYLHKPYDIKDLKRTIRELLD